MEAKRQRCEDFFPRMTKFRPRTCATSFFHREASSRQSSMRDLSASRFLIPRSTSSASLMFSPCTAAASGHRVPSASIWHVQTSSTSHRMLSTRAAQTLQNASAHCCRACSDEKNFASSLSNLAFQLVRRRAALQTSPQHQDCMSVLFVPLYGCKIVRRSTFFGAANILHPWHLTTHHDHRPARPERHQKKASRPRSECPRSLHVSTSFCGQIT